MAKAKALSTDLETSELNDWDEIKKKYTKVDLTSFKCHDAFNIKGKVSSYWHKNKSSIANLKLTWYVEAQCLEFSAAGCDTICVPFSNVPFFAPCTSKKAIEHVIPAITDSEVVYNG